MAAKKTLLSWVERRSLPRWSRCQVGLAGSVQPMPCCLAVHSGSRVPAVPALGAGIWKIKLKMGLVCCWREQMAHVCLYVVVQLLSRAWLFATPWTAAHQASLSFINSQSLLRLMSTESVMPSNHLILFPPSPLTLNLSQHQGVFHWESFLWVICNKGWKLAGGVFMNVSLPVLCLGQMIHAQDGKCFSKSPPIPLHPHGNSGTEESEAQRDSNFMSGSVDCYLCCVPFSQLLPHFGVLGSLKLMLRPGFSLCLQ